MFKHVLIPTDSSPASNKAAKAGIALAQALSAKVTAYCALSALEPIDLGGYEFERETIDGFEESTRKAGQASVAAIVKMARSAGVSCASMVAKARTPYEGIINVAKKQNCDVIFMATHGRRGFSKLMMGSVTQKVLALSTIPVVVYR